MLFRSFERDVLADGALEPHDRLRDGEPRCPEEERVGERKCQRGEPVAVLGRNVEESGLWRREVSRADAGESGGGRRTAFSPALFGRWAGRAWRRGDATATTAQHRRAATARGREASGTRRRMALKLVGTSDQSMRHGGWTGRNSHRQREGEGERLPPLVLCRTEEVVPHMAVDDAIRPYLL